MEQQELISNFLKFGLSALLGFVIGLERAREGTENPHASVRDFVIFALVGATCAFAATQYNNAWIIVSGFFGVLVLLVSGYWAEHQRKNEFDPGITTEAAVVVTFFLGVLIIKDAAELAVAVAIVLMLVLSEKKMIERFSTQIQSFELQATLKLLVISFIILPVLPHKSLDNYVTFPVGHVQSVDADTRELAFAPAPNQLFARGGEMYVYVDGKGEIGRFNIADTSDESVSLQLQQAQESFAELSPGTQLRMPYVPRFVSVLLSALKPFQVWLIVVLVSFIGFVGYVLIKVVGAGAGVALTGLIGGLASSTVTTLSFAARSKELPQLNRMFAVAIILASSIMFPRVVLQIGVFNQQLMASIALPMLVTGGTGLLMAAFFYWRARGKTAEAQEISFENPFSLRSALTFGLVFATILVVTRLATAYLGDAWLPVVALVSGLTDADAIAFSVSNLQRSGVISLDWASFNLVLGSLSNTAMKLFLVFSLGHRELFKHCLVSFCIMGAAGIATMYLYYDIF
jgi:uncharacterized membrane protein (DUF4010 family)